MNFDKIQYKNIFEKFEKNTFLLSLSLVFILFSLFLSIFKSTWSIDDDVLMAMHVSGKGFSNQPTEYIFFSNIIIGKFLKNLYQMIPSYPWYGLYTFCILFISSFVLLYSLLKFKYSRTRVVYFLIYFILFGFFFIRTPEFTVTAFVIGISGIFLFLAHIYNERREIPYKIIMISALLLSLSSLIRMESFFLVIILTLPVIILGIVKNFNKQITVKFSILFLLTCFIVLVCYRYNKTSYLQDERWAHQLERAKLLVELVDNNKAYIYSSETKHIFDNAGWSKNDFLLKHYWFFADDTIFSKEKIEKILSGFHDIRIKRPTIHFKSMFSDMYFYGSWFLALYFIIQIRDKKKNALEIAVSLIISVSILIYLGYYLRLPTRIYMSILSFLSFLALFFADKDMNDKASQTWVNKVKFLCILLFIVYFLFLHYRIFSIQQKGSFLLKYYINQLHPTKEHVFLVWAKSIPLEFIPVFDDLNDFSQFTLLSTGYQFNSPITAEVLKEFNVKTFGELIEKDNLFHIGNLTHMALFAQYLKEHYNMDVAFKLYMDNIFFKVYKHIKIDTEKNNTLTHVPVNIEGVKYNIFITQ